MPLVETVHGPVSYCVLIPSRGRAEALARSLRRMPWLNEMDTWIGIETREFRAYRLMLNGAAPYVRTLGYKNPLGSVAVAREQLRQHAMSVNSYQYFVVTDDNAIHASEGALKNMVRACAEFPRPCIMAGMHGTAMHFDRGKIGKAETINGLRSYPVVAAIFQCYPRSLYESYIYPDASYGLDDRHYFLWLLAQGHTEFRACMEAPFTKSRYQPGGQGTLDERAMKCGLAIAKLAGDFPKLVGAVGTLRIPWQHLITSIRSGGRITGNRLVGGAMRKEASLQKSSKIMVRVRRTSPNGE